MPFFYFTLVYCLSMQWQCPSWSLLTYMTLQVLPLSLMVGNIVAGGAASYNINSNSPLNDTKQQEWVLQEVAYKSQSTMINQNSKGLLMAQNCQFRIMIIFFILILTPPPPPSSQNGVAVLSDWSEAKFCILSQLSEPQRYLNGRDLRAFMCDLALFPISDSRWSSKIRGKANHAMFKESNS